MIASTLMVTSAFPAPPVGQRRELLRSQIHTPRMLIDFAASAATGVHWQCVDASVSSPAESQFAVGSLDGRDVHVWSVQTHAPDPVVRHLEEWLAPDEKLRANRFRFPHLRQSFIIARGALRALLACYLDTLPERVEFTYGVNGKPGVKASRDLHFNLSHSGGLAVLAFTLGCELGVDVEQKREIKDVQQLASRFFSTDEASELLSLQTPEQQRAFFLCWTRKEAYIKATGEGLSVALDSFRVSLLPAQPAAMIHIRGDVEAAQEWTLHTFDLASTCEAALAYRDRKRPIRLHPTLDPARLLTR